jgi:hypothetical protein
MPMRLDTMTVLTAPSRIEESITAKPSIECRLCDGLATPLFEQRVLGRWDVEYFQCPGCDLIQSEKPTWLAEAYSSAICAADTGAIQRNYLTAELTTAVAWVLGIKPHSPCCDYGGGHGVLVRLMRDRGFDFRLLDRYAANLFARGFEADPSTSFEMVTAFEVFEHFDDVAKELSNVFASRPAVVLAGTMLHHGHEPGWWYYTPSTGQHIAFYSQKTMQFVARRFGYAVSGSRAYTLFIRQDAGVAKWRIALARWLVRKSKGNATNGWVKALLKMGPRFESRTLGDCGLLNLP